MTPAELRELAARGRKQAEALETLADAMEKAGAENAQELFAALQSVHKSNSVNAMTSADHGMATSRGRSRSNPLTKAANANDMTLTALAKRCGVSVGLLSKAAKGQRSIPAAIAAQIEDLTGYKAIPANWPGRIV